MMALPDRSREEFVSEPITPEAGSFSPQQMATGLAALPAAFVWRNRRYAIVECLDHRKVSSPEGGVEGNEVYLRRQVFSVLLDTGQHATIYVQRHAPRAASAGAARRLWFLYSIESEPPDPLASRGR